MYTQVGFYNMLLIQYVNKLYLQDMQLKFYELSLMPTKLNTISKQIFQNILLFKGFGFDSFAKNF